ncbi:helix-turn-helix domain-containing protein [Anaerobutyricum hallii]|uniref:XRE family transcriptional regulator n=1 Tax=Anaerobutyricum hallii TaxID=39488 RepID=A0A415U4P6_9FIRM|nr:helix-turn-helix transcriptional regulator [Anaerobutyricum hallii]RHN13079.1 XRE family transcriptional regulator [Anaerobutyricum hallii]
MNQENKEKEINWKETRLHIRKLIKNNDYTIVEFSNKMCMSDSAIKNYLYGKVIPSVDVLHHYGKGIWFRQYRRYFSI